MIIIITGRTGTGKTLLATYLASKSEKRVLANYQLNIPQAEPDLIRPQDLSALEQPTLVILDEAYTWLEARTSGRLVNRYISYIAAFQQRKRAVDTILTVQLFDTVDKRFREMADTVIHADGETSEGYHYWLWEPGGRAKGFTLPFHEAERIYPLFNTYEMVNPVDDDMVSLISTDPDQIYSRVEEFAESILGEYQGMKITQSVVRDWCLRNKIPKHLNTAIWDHIQVRRATDGET